MKRIQFKPFENTQGCVEGYLHDRLTEMDSHRSKFPCVVVCPGGGYQMLSEREADPVALRYFAAGFQVFILRYSVKEHAGAFTPLKELSETLCNLRAHAEEWDIEKNKIAVCGFSAGGHLTGTLGTLWNHTDFLRLYDNRGGMNRPNAIILSYPVIMSEGRTHIQSIETVSRNMPEGIDREIFSVDKQVTKDTPPTFIWHTVADHAVPVENALSLMTALQAQGISFEAHLFPSGEHGISVCTEEVGTYDAYNAAWMDMSIKWLYNQFSFRL